MTKLDRSEQATNNRQQTLINIGLAAALTVIFAVVNWHWLQVNVVTYGWDRLDHLITTLVFHNMFSSPSATTVYDALAYAAYYPPLVHYTSALLYQIFGVSEEIAIMANVVFLFILFLATGSIARRLSGMATAALSVLLLGLVPMIYAMSRYLYLDFALTALVTTNVALLLASERIRRRGPILWFGFAIGVSFLVKWTTAAFLFGPLLYVVVRSGVVPYMVKHPRALLPNWLHMGIALAAAALINLAWLYPARDAVAFNPVGWWLFPAFTLLLGGVFYALFAAKRDGDGVAQALSNAFGAAIIGAWIIALWYLTNTEFIHNFVYTAYGREEGKFMAYGKYFYEVTTEQMGLFFAVLFAVVVIVWLIQQGRELPNTLKNLSDTAWVLVIWVALSYFIFSNNVSLAHSRFVMPFLPPFAIWVAAGLLSWRPKALRWTAIGLVLAVLIVQFALISFKGLADWRTRFTVSIAGQEVNLLANGFFIQYPASGATDPGYALADDVLELVEHARIDAGKEVIDLGLLVNWYQLHEKHFLYEIYMRYPQVRLRELARNWREQPAYNQLFEMDYVLVMDTHTYRTHESSQEVAQRVLEDPEDLFNQAFQPVELYTFPSGEQLTLYNRRFEPTEPGLASEDYHLLLESLIEADSEGDAVLLAAPDQAYMMGLLLPEKSAVTVAPLSGSEDAIMERLVSLAEEHDRLFLVRHNIEQVDPDGRIEAWLRENLFAGSDVWLNSLRVTPFVVRGDGDPVETAVDATWVDGPTLEKVIWNPTTTAGDEATAGGALSVELFWTQADDQLRKVSLQLLSPDGALVAQNDQEIQPGDGGQRFVLLIPQSVQPGEYPLTAAVYDPASGERFLLEDGSDRLVIDGIVVR